MSDLWSPSDLDLLGALRRMWDLRDPTPVGLADDLVAALAGHDLAAEWATLRLVGDNLVGVRSTSETSTLEFDLGEVSLLVRVAPESPSSGRLDGWLTSDTPLPQNRVVLITDAQERTSVIDADGRFEFGGVHGHRWRLRFLTDDGTARLQTPDMPWKREPTT